MILNQLASCPHQHSYTMGGGTLKSLPQCLWVLWTNSWRHYFRVESVEQHCHTLTNHSHLLLCPHPFLRVQRAFTFSAYFVIGYHPRYHCGMRTQVNQFLFVCLFVCLKLCLGLVSPTWDVVRASFSFQGCSLIAVLILVRLAHFVPLPPPLKMEAY